MCLGNSVFNGVLGMSITATNFAPEVVKFCCDCVCVEYSSIIVICGEVKQCSVRCNASEWMRVRSTASICALVTK